MLYDKTLIKQTISDQMNTNSTTTKSISLILAGSIFLTSCASTTMIQSTPVGAKIYLNGENVGTTPYEHRDTKILGSTTTVKLQKEGYEELVTSFSRSEEADVGAIIGGIFLLVPFLWTMKYKPNHNYEMIPISNVGLTSTSGVSEPSSEKSKAESLKELKKLFDDKLITSEEYERQKKSILDKI